ncbi:integrase [Croceifilum oryzae]|uniref:Integrase n=1 Tax=Croceifilum oryzae TaxID=1553429 RepID=A0AAJ1WT17_9BACL|nr:site-specific integrase [Croceifilum oryzae]MDQ0417568.1 integrase [Croceifilum oryzae]
MKGSFKKESKREGHTWMFRVDIGLDERGVRRQATRRGFKTRKEAEEACNQIIHQVSKGTYVEPTKCTLGTYLLDWIESTAKQRVRLKTYDSYKYIIDNKLIPELGNIPLDKLTPMHIQNFYAKKSAEGLSAEYVKHMHVILSSSLDQAVSWKLIRSNPVKITSPPKISHKEQKTWSIEEAKIFLTHTEQHPLHIAYLLAIYTGMRMGEILGLRWEDCDLENKMIRIRQGLSCTSEGTIFEDPKSKASRRAIAITENIVDALEKRQREQKRNKNWLGQAYKENNLVVCTKKGTPIGPSNLRRHFWSTIEKAGVPRIRFHDTRHTHATIMLTLGEHPKVVSERLGHSKTSITLDVYSHVMKSIQEDAAKNFSNAFQTAT